MSKQQLDTFICNRCKARLDHTVEEDYDEIQMLMDQGWLVFNFPLQEVHLCSECSSDAETFVTDLEAFVHVKECPMNVYCEKHGFHHGAEATELREGIEKLMKEEDPVSNDSLQHLLDQVDARDSLAYEEMKDKDSSN